MSAIIEFRNVSKVFGEGDARIEAVRDVSLQVHEREFVALRGPSGCGKSTLLHLAGALERPTSGEVLVSGRDVSRMSAKEQANLRRRDVGYVFQKLNLISGLTAMENVMLPLEMEGRGTREARRLAAEALESVGLNQKLDRYPDDFSGGQQQRIAIARALAGDRKVLLADEPTGALDTVSGENVIDTLSALPALRGTAVVLVTHEPRFAAWADRVVSLRDGEIVGESRADARAGV